MNKLEQFWQSRTPAARLATGYALIIMVLSLTFSLALYHLSAGQLSESLRHQYLRYRALPGFSRIALPNPVQYQTELALGEDRLTLELVYFNLIILVVASGISYWLARRTLRPIEEALEAQSRFAADASHELRTPLAAMQAEIEVALRDPKMTQAAAKTLLNSNLEEVAKLKALSEGLLALARQDGNEHTTAEPLKLSELINAATKLVGPAARAKKIHFQLELADLTVAGDATRLEELVVILIDNAVKYSPAGTTVSLTAQKQAKFAEVTVRDQGPGIDQKDLPHIFDRFYRADRARSKEKTNGYGLGLSIAQKIVEQHHGTIGAESSRGGGSKFTVRLPLA